MLDLFPVEILPLPRQVPRNLFSNAVEYTAGQPQPTAEMQASISPEEILFSVRDNRAGLDGRFAGMPFGGFQRLHRMEEFEGTGTELANVKRIVGCHCGRVWAEGEVGKGASFLFTLPAAPHGEHLVLCEPPPGGARVVRNG